MTRRRCNTRSVRFDEERVHGGPSRDAHRAARAGRGRHRLRTSRRTEPSAVGMPRGDGAHERFRRAANLAATRWGDSRTEEFDHSARVVFPSEVRSLVAELWGGGGGGGAGSIERSSKGGAGGGGGASGAYIRGSVTLTPGATYTFVIGQGGRGGSAYSQSPIAAGENGGPSAICAGDVPLLVAAGGTGGQSARSNARGGSGGIGLSAAAWTSLIRCTARAPTERSDRLPFEVRGRGGLGGRPVSGRVQPPGAFGGDGGAGAMAPEPARDGLPGGPGSISVAW